MNIRYLKTGANSAAFNMGLDEVMMRRVTVHEPVLRFYSWSPPAVSIGYFQGLEEEVDLQACEKAGVDVVRRITGGGAVFHDTELTYSYITREYPKDILESYHLICGGIIKGLQRLGIEAQYAPINDILVNGKKVSGNAQTRKQGALLQHGTILLKVDVEKMFSLLRVPSEKIRDKMVQSVKERVAGLEKNWEEVAPALEQGFSEVLGGSLQTSELTEEEREAAQLLARKKYASHEWNFFR
ncbi:lipoate--protein ligase family protein [Candidatus Micrarchaeota archaeon]|nr:lipoate--protein ligase family protein [Candidatus Micrarchaeota archaeon]